MIQAMSKNGRILALFALGCTLAVGLVNLVTKDTIKKQTQLQLLSRLHEIIDEQKVDNDLAASCIALNSPALGNGTQQAYLATFENQPIAAAITTTAPDGYNGKIELIVALNYVDNSISGVRTVKHAETPGLGDKIELRKDEWILSFNGKRIAKANDVRWAVEKDGGQFDQFTGATITPRAVVNAVKRTALYFAENKETLFAQSPNCGGES